MNLPIVAIIGRPNVGKSTLFNRILGRRQAVVHDLPGVTRDRHYAPTDWERRRFYLVDTGGLTTEAHSALLDQVRAQAEAAIEEADVVLFLVDAKVAPTDLDEAIAKGLFRHAGKVLLVVNKADGEREEWESAAWLRLGLGGPCPVSALHGRGVGDLLSEVVRRLPPRAAAPAEDPEAIRVAVVGRPNVGKSSLVNALLQRQRMVVDPTPGTTRDAVDSEVVVSGRRFVLVDTAGLRRAARVKDSTEFFSVLRTRQSLERCHVAVLLLDASEPLSAQDVHVAAEVAELRRAAVLAFNKWDLVEKQTNTARDMERAARERMPFMDYAPALFLSALTRQRASSLWPLLERVHAQATRRVGTGELNRFFEQLQKRNPAPASKSGLRPRIYYAAQTGVLPPTFSLFVNHPRAVAPNYVRFLEHRMRDEMEFTGTPLALRFRKSE
ncbi:MAG TPA: ribosome biogenesis GTPase Der [Candidatus Saccharimonadales bacterium]|nr:ribosome biogenesis GTPase Der [Candidatus Saccharimonadales bacterium]